ncbi:hypothetical protein CRUP_006001, partial [Coryphaenoides rupestris]
MLDPVQHKEEEQEQEEEVQEEEEVSPPLRHPSLAAAGCYTKAIKLSDGEAERAVLYRNRSACYLRLEDYAKAEADAAKALDTDPGDVKARFRRAQACQKLGRLDQAFVDAQQCAQLEPKNSAFQDLLRVLGAQIQQKVKQQNSTDARVQQMFSLLLDASATDSDRQKLRMPFHSLPLRMQIYLFSLMLVRLTTLCHVSRPPRTLVVLAREDAGADQIFRNDGVKLIQRLLESKQEDIVLSALRTLVGLCTGHQSRAAAGCYTKAIKLSDGEAERAVLYRNRSACYLRLEDYAKAEADAAKALDTDPGDVKARFRRAQACQKLGRLDQAFVDAQQCAQLEPKNSAFQDLLRVLGAQIQQKLCEVMGSGTSAVSLAACHLLQVMFEALTEGMTREIRGKDEAILPDSAINLLVKQVPRKSQKNPDNSVTLWVIDQGPGGGGVGPRGLPGSPPLTENSHMSCSVLLGKLYDDLQSDKERENFSKLCEDYIQQHFGRPDLEGKLRAIQTASTLLQGPSEAGNRALEVSGVMDAVIALCASKDVAHQQVAVEALIHAAGKAKRASFITANGGLCKLGSAGGTDFSMKQFAEGSTVKLAKQCRKWLCNDSLSAASRRWSVDGLAYLTFDADVKEDLVEDKGALRAMFDLAKSEDKTVLFAVGSTLVNCTNSYDVEKPDPQMLELAKYAKQHRQQDRGAVVAQGGGKALIPLASDNTTMGKVKSAQALAKITITSNPEIAFPGERKMIKEKAVSKIEGYMFEEHELVRAAATECMCNMVLSTEVQQLYVLPGNDRLKLLVLYSGEDDERLRSAAAGTLAMLTAEQPELCARVPATALLLSEVAGLRQRGAAVVRNLMQGDRGVAETLMASEALEILSVLAKGGSGEGEAADPVSKVAQSCLDTAMEYGIIQSS